MTKLNQAIEDIANIPENEKQNLAPQGKPPRFYTMVHTRVEALRKTFAENSKITTEIISSDLEFVCMKATVAVKHDGEWVTLGTGHAEEYRGTNFINKASALENCETSAIGRALASLGIHGGEYASAFEIDNAKNNKASVPDTTQGYSIRSEKGKIIEYAPDSTIFLKHLRVYLKDEKAETSQSLYKINQAEIKKAKTNSDNEKDIKAFEKLINLYEIDEQTK